MRDPIPPININMLINLIPNGRGDFLSSCSFDVNNSFTDFLVKKIKKYSGIAKKIARRTRKNRIEAAPGDVAI